MRERIGLDEIAARATLWSEVCGSAFYKILWDENGGRQVAVDENGAPVYEGEISVEAVPPFEIFPDSLGAEDLGGVRSLIHARAVPVSAIAEKFGVALRGREIAGLAPAGYSEPSAWKIPRARSGRQPDIGAGFGDPHRAVYPPRRRNFPRGSWRSPRGENCSTRGRCPIGTAIRDRGIFPSSGRTACGCPAPFSGAAS